MRINPFEAACREITNLSVRKFKEMVGSQPDVEIMAIQEDNRMVWRITIELTAKQVMEAHFNGNKSHTSRAEILPR